jgi:hypothetical protein
MSLSRRWRLAVVAAVMALVVVGAELGARLLSPYLDEPLVWADETTQLKVAQMDERGCADLVIVGNSMARDDVQPALLEDALGVEAYNASLDAAGPSLLSRWVHEEVSPRLDPSTVVLALSSADLNDNSEAARAAQAGYDASVMGRDDAIGRLGAFATEHSDLVRYRVELRRPDAVWDALGRALRGDDPDQRDGTDPSLIGPDGEGLSRRALTYDGSSVSATFAQSQLLGDFVVGGAQLQSARALVDDLQDDGVEVVLVILPVTDDYQALHPEPETDMATFLRVVDDLADETGATVVDLHDAPYGDELFADTHHLNGAGSERLTRELADRLGDDLDRRCAT